MCSIESVMPLQVEASEGLYSVTEAFLYLTRLLIQSGLHTATLQVLSACPQLTCAHVDIGRMRKHHDGHLMAMMNICLSDNSSVFCTAA